MMKKRLMSILLAVVMAVTVYHAPVFAGRANGSEAAEIENVVQTGSSLKVKCKPYISSNGWTKAVTKGAAGTVGEGKAIEALQLSVTGNKKVGIRYKAYSKSYGWQAWKHDGKTAGTTGKSIPVEAVCIELTGKQAWKYDIYYRVHSQDFGWMDWTKNGEIAGSVGFSKRMEAIQIVVVKKNRKAPGETARPNRMEQKVKYRGYVQSFGWQDAVYNGATAGTEGLGKRLEAFKASVPNNKNLGLQYSAHVQSVGWMNPVSDKQIAGTMGKSLRIEALRINLTGADASYYNVWYRVHVQGYGWIGWAKNGETAGSIGQNRRVEAMQIRILPKEVDAPGSTKHAMLNPNVTYIWPVPGWYAISSYFGPRWAPLPGASTEHPAVDVPCSIGTPILAAQSGVVKVAEYEKKHGLMMIIDHENGMETVYAHNSSFAVAVGQRVEAGQVVAYSGNTGISTGAHCHFGMRLAGEFVDPLPYYPNIRFTKWSK